MRLALTFSNRFRMGEVTSVEQLPLPKRTVKTTAESKQSSKQSGVQKSKKHFIIYLHREII